MASPAQVSAMPRTLVLVSALGSLAIIAGCGPDAPGPPDTLPGDVELPDALPDDTTLPEDSALPEDTALADAADDTLETDTTAPDTTDPGACKPDGGACDAPCFTSGRCETGTCVGVPGTEVVCDLPGDGACVTGYACDPATGQCTDPVPAEAGVSCERDDDPCTFDVCDDGGACVDSGGRETCADESAADPCWTWACGAESGCARAAFIDGGSCDDGDACTLSDSCQADGQGGGSCVGAPYPIDDGDPCTVDSCDDGTVTHAPANGLDCTVDDLCRGDGTCQDGDCVAPVVVTCDDGDPCTDDSCDPATGACLTPNAEDGTACTVDDLCRGAGTCQSGACDAPVVVTCDDGDPCTADACDPATGACLTPDAEDGTACTTSDLCRGDGTCQSGACDAPVVVTCDDGDPCTDDSCDPATGACLTPDAEDGTTCDDLDACTSDDRCTAGQCGGSAVSPCCADSLCEEGEDCACGGCAEVARCRCPDGDVDGDDRCADEDNCDDVANADQLDTDDDGAGDACDTDDDDDGVPDDEDANPLDETFCRDADEDGCDDCASGSDDPANDGDDADGDGICDLGDVCPGGDDTVDVDDNGVPDACECSGFEALDTETHDLDADPGDFGTLYATTSDLSAWSATRSNVIAKVHVYDRVVGQWKKTTLPGMYYGGAATLSLLRAAGDVLWFAHPYPDAGSQGDRLYRYDAGADAPVVTDLRDEQSDPGNIVTDHVAVTSALAAFHTQRNNVTSRLFVHRRQDDAWSVVTLPTRSSGGRAVIRAMAASGPLLVYGWDHPNTSTNGDVVNVYEASADATASWDTQDIVADPGDMLPTTLTVTPALAAFHTQRSNVTSRLFRYRVADGAWTTVTLPTRSSGGRAVVKAIGADQDLLFYAWDHPNTSTQGDVVTLYDATSDTEQSWETADIVSDPGDMVASQVTVTSELVAFATKRSNVISRVLIYDRGEDGWTQVLLPTMYYGGRADLRAIHAAGSRLYAVYPNPTGGGIGERIYIYDAVTHTLDEVDTVDVQNDPGQMLVDLVAVTPDLFAFHTQRSNVKSRVFMYDACADAWRVEDLPTRSTGGKAVVETLEAAGPTLVYTYDHPDHTVRGDVVSERRPCGCQ